MIELQQTAAAIYLAAGVGALIGIALPSERASRGAVWGLALGAVVQGMALGTLHRLDPVPSLTSLPLAVSFMVWIAVLSLLVFMWRVRLAGLAAVAGPVAFLAVFLASLHLPAAQGAVSDASGAMPHAHVLLSSAGLGLLGVSGVAGIFYLIEHRRLKRKRPVSRTLRLPSLEALDRVNVAALAVGFPLLTLGVITGAAWLHDTRGRAFSGSDHEMWTIIAWGIYAGLAAARFGGRQGARQAAASAVAGFAFLLFAVVGVGWLT
jgi:ABC-type transport system involved in cytochrome c biogenesis permease subunit